MLLVKLVIMSIMLKGSVLGCVDVVADNVPHFEEVGAVKTTVSKTVRTDEDWMPNPNGINIFPDFPETHDGKHFFKTIKLVDAYGKQVVLLYDGTRDSINLEDVTKDNWYLWQKPNKDPRYGCNIGESFTECEVIDGGAYEDGEELFYGDDYDHWNVALVYDKRYVEECRNNSKPLTEKVVEDTVNTVEESEVE